MPNPVNNLKDEQWETCERCGFDYPMSEMRLQQGSLRCFHHCIDDLESVRREQVIQRVLVEKQEESTDTRWINRAFLDHTEEEVL